MAADEAYLLDAVGNIYDCALHPALWSGTLERLAPLFNSCSASIQRRGTHDSFRHCWNWTEHWLDRYVDRYMRINPLLTVGWHVEVAEVASLTDLIDRDEFNRTEFYRDFWAVQGWWDLVAAILEKSADSYSVLCITRDEAAGDTTEADRALLRLLVPHFRRAIVINGILEASRSQISDLSLAFDLLPTPLLLFDANARCIATNAAAEELLGTTRILPLRQGEIDTAGSAPRREIVTAIKAVGTVASLSAARNAVVLTAEDGSHFACHILPVTTEAHRQLGAGGRAAAAMFVQKVGSVRPLPGEVLVKLYGLTPAESRLLGMLGQGFSVEESADALGVTLATARTHLQHIFQKTGTRRQPELVRLVQSAVQLPPIKRKT